MVVVLSPDTVANALAALFVVVLLAMAAYDGLRVALIRLWRSLRRHRG